MEKHKHKINKAVLLALLALLTGGGVVVGTTVALFQTQTTAHIHIISGSLDVKFFLTEVDSIGFDPSGHQLPDPVKKDLSGYPGYTEGKGVDGCVKNLRFVCERHCQFLL